MSADRDTLDKLLDAVDEEVLAAVELRHELHRSPEPSGTETRTAARVVTALGEPDAPVVAGTGRLVRLGAPTGACVAVRAELDALAVVERTGVPYAATNGAMHACGHDVHLAALVAVARAVCRVGVPVPLLAVLQPREEAYPSGAYDITDSGVLTGHEVGAMVGVHLQPQLPVGTVAADPGVVNASCDEVEITVRGAGGHGGYPHLARDPVPVLCQCVVALQQAVRDAVDPMHPAVVTIGNLRAGSAPNVIAETAYAHGTVRTFGSTDRDRLFAAIRNLVSGYAAAHGCTADVRFLGVEPSLANDPALASGAASWLARAGFAAAPEFRSCGSDDFACYAAAAPSLMMFLGAGEGADQPMLHDARFLPADARVRDVAFAMVAGYLAGCDLLSARA